MDKFANNEVFVAFHRAQGMHSEVELEFGIHYDVAGDIDQRNGWREDGEQTDDRLEIRERIQSESARGLKELFLFCFNSNPLGPDGAGVQLAFQRFMSVAYETNRDALRTPLRPNGKAHGPIINRSQLAAILGVSPDVLRSMWKSYRQRWPFTARVEPIKRAR